MSDTSTERVKKVLRFRRTNLIGTQFFWIQEEFMFISRSLLTVFECYLQAIYLKDIFVHVVDVTLNCFRVILH